MTNRRWTRGIFLGVAIAMTGCMGVIGGDDGATSNGGPNGEGPLDVASSAIRRMTPEQYLNTARDLFGDPGLELPLDPDEGTAMTLLGAEKINAAADFIVSRSDAWTREVFPCDVDGAADDACVDAFITAFGRRAFRHPVSEDERSWLRGVYDAAITQQTFKDSLLITLKVMLQSPQLLYFYEEGNDPPAGLTPGVRPLTSFERASRLSYFLWNSTPDDMLLDAAESGALDDAAGVQNEADRLLADPRARAVVKELFIGWLELDGSPTHPGLDEGTKSASIFPEDSPELRLAMRKEIEALIERVMFDEQGTLASLITSNEAYVNASLAKLYGVAGPADDATFAWVTLPKDQRAGLFTRAAFLTTYSRADIKSPIRRGAYLVKKALCVKLGQPPPNAADTPVTGGTVDQNGMKVRRTVREDVSIKTSSATCSSCHSLINPIGFTFEHFDALGRWQTVEQGQDDNGMYTLPIDATGALPNFDDTGAMADGVVEVDGANEMSSALAASPGLGACVAQKWFQAALRRVPSDQDVKTATQLRGALESGATLPDIVTTIVGSDAFLYLRPSQD